MSLHGLDIAYTGLAAYSQQIQVIGNNIANLNTNAFKRNDLRFQDVLYEINQMPGKTQNPNTNNGVGVQFGKGVQISSNPTIFEQGPLIQGVDFDVAISGEGFFRVIDAEGEVFYTRLGAFQPKGIGASGIVHIQTSEGAMRLDPQIRLPGNNDITVVTPTGQVQQGSFSAQLRLTRFQNPDGLEQVGDLLFRETSAVGAITTGVPGVRGFGTIVNGALEGSNVDLLDELVGLVEASQAFSLNSQTFITGNEEVLEAINLSRQA